MPHISQVNADLIFRDVEPDSMLQHYLGAHAEKFNDLLAEFETYDPETGHEQEYKRTLLLGNLVLRAFNVGYRHGTETAIDRLADVINGVPD